MKIYRSLLTILLIAIVLSGCMPDNNDLISQVGANQLVNFSIQVPGLTPVSTRTLNEADENQVESVEILLFNSANGHLELASNPIYVNSIQDDPNHIGIKVFSAKIPIGTYDVVILANAHNELSSMVGTSAISIGDNKEDVLGKLTVANDGKWKSDPSASDYRSIPMWGEVPSLTVGPNTPTNIPVMLIRMLAKIEVVLANANAIANFKLKSVRLYNVNNKGYIAPLPNNWDSNQSRVIAPSVPPTAVSNFGPLIYEGTEINQTDIACTNQIYAFEHVKKASANVFPLDPCLIIGGIYNGDSAETFYRVEFAKNTSTQTTYLDILRNHSYKVKIVEVSGRGFATYSEAFASKPVNMAAEIVQWDDAVITKFAFNGQFVLGFSQNEFNFGPESVNQASSDNFLFVNTDYPSGWQIDKVVDDAGNPVTWLTTDVSSGQLNSNSGVRLLLSENTGSARTAYIHFISGRITYVVKVTQKNKELTNCYLLAPGENVDIPLDMVNLSDLGMQWRAGDAVTAELVWTDNANKIAANSNIKTLEIRGGSIHVVAGSAEGNAVVAVKKNGQILWSWHIWVTNYDPTPIGEGRFMDRNLGAISNMPGSAGNFGLLYQWGRKDPFPGSASTSRGQEQTIYNSTGVASIAKSTFTDLQSSVRGPLTYTTNQSWVGSLPDIYNNNLSWGNGIGKSVYDPCPEGWRVPEKSVWNGVITGGFVWSRSGFDNPTYGGYYPPAGFRDYDTGGLNITVGYYGNYWSDESYLSGTASIVKVGYCLSFSNTGADINGTSLRAAASSIRCVEE